jgi:hypothetical protein
MTVVRRTLVASLLVTASALAADPEVNAAPVAEAPAAKPAEAVAKPAEPVAKATAAASTDAPYEKPTRGEQLAFYTAGGVYGLTAGVWVNSLFGLTNPGLAAIFPVALGAGGVVAAYAMDTSLAPRRGVLAATTLGMGLGAANGAGIAITQGQYNDKSNSWNYATQGTFTFLLMTAGAAGGYAYGEYVHPDTKAIAFVGNGAAWGAMTGALFGAGVTGGEWSAGASLWGTIGLNIGAASTASLAAMSGAPSLRTQRYMWYGYGAGTALSSLVYIAYAFSDDNPRAGLVTNALGGVAGLAVGAVLGAGLEDEPETASTTWSNTHFGFAPVQGGGVAMASGSF